MAKVVDLFFRLRTTEHCQLAGTSLDPCLAHHRPQEDEKDQVNIS